MGESDGEGLSRLSTFVSVSVTGTADGASAVLTAPYGDQICSTGTCTINWLMLINGGTYDYTLVNNGGILRSYNDRMQEFDRAAVKDYTRIN